MMIDKTCGVTLPKLRL